MTPPKKRGEWSQERIRAKQTKGVKLAKKLPVAVFAPFATFARAS